MNNSLELFTLEEDLKVSNNHLNNLKKQLIDDPNNEILKQIIHQRTNEVEVIQNKINVLNALIKLENDYKESKPIIFHYVDDDGISDDIELGSHDINYERAYTQQKKLLELEYNHINKKPLNYSGKIISFDDENYDNVYHSFKDEILNMPALNTKKTRKSEATEFETTPFAFDNLDSEYVLFEKDGYLNIVGNFTSDFIKDNFYKLDSDLVNGNFKKIRIYNNLKYGITPLAGLDVKVNLSPDGTIKIEGDVDKIDYHHSTLEDVKENKETKQVHPDKTLKEEKSIVKDDSDEQHDYSGLDKMGDMPSDNSLEHGAEGIEPVIPSTPIKRHKAKPSLLKRAKEKFSNLKKWQKVAIVAGVIAAAGIGVAVIGPHVMEAINNLLNPENVNTVNNAIGSAGNVSDPVTAASSAASSLDYSGMGGAGQTVFTNAGDAVNNANGVISNQWFSNNPVDVFNTATGSYMGLTPEQLADPQLMAELAKDPNNAMLFGNSISDPSGFMGLDDVVSAVTKVR